MKRLVLCLSAVVGAGLFAGAAADARLLSQRLRGTSRVCVYDARTTIRQKTETVERLVGRGEPCPRRDPGPPTARRERPPSMAQLSGEIVENGQKYCVYAYLGRRYPWPVAPSAQCPLTPHFMR